MTQKKILVADDEKDIVELIAYNLEREGFAVLRAYDGQKAWEMINAEKPDLVILDLMMPEMSGMEVCRTDPAPGDDRRPAHHHADRQVGPRGQDPGAGDRGGRLHHQTVSRPGTHRPRPRRPAAVGAASRRRICRKRSIIRGLHVDFTSYQVTVDGRPVELSSREFKLLQFFIGHPGRVYSRDQLLDRVWGDEAFVEPRTVDVHISRLRGAIEPDKENPQYILTVRGIGYKFTDTDA